MKELEQQVQCLEAQKRKLLVHQQHVAAAKPDATPMHASSGSTTTKTCCADSAAATTTTSNCSSSVTEDAHAPPPPFAQFFTYPQYVWCHHSARDSPAAATAAAEGEDGRRSGVADVEVTLVETHASVRVMTTRRPGQLLCLVTGLQALRLAVLHLSVTTLDALVLYSISVKVHTPPTYACVRAFAAASKSFPNLKVLIHSCVC